MSFDALGDGLVADLDLEDAAGARYQRRIDGEAFAKQAAASLARFS